MSEERRLVQSVEITDSGIHILQLKSVLDASTVPELEEALNYLLSQNYFHFIVDLTHVEFVSSAGWGVFVGELKKIRQAGGDIKLAAMQPEVLDVFMLLELDQLIQAFSSVEEAIAAFLKTMPRPYPLEPERHDLPEPAAEPDEQPLSEEAVDEPEGASLETASPEPPPEQEVEDIETDLETAAQTDATAEASVDEIGLFDAETPPDSAEAENDLLATPSVDQTELDIEEARRAIEADDEQLITPPTRSGDLSVDKHASAEVSHTGDWQDAVIESSEPDTPPQNQHVPEPDMLSQELDPEEAVEPDVPAMAPTGQESQTDAERLENPFDIAEIDDPWLGGTEMEYDENKLRSRLSDARLDEVDLNVPDFQPEMPMGNAGAMKDGEPGAAGPEEVTEEDYENLQWLKHDAATLFENSDNGRSEHPNRLLQNERQRSRTVIEDDALSDKIIDVVIANPNYGPSAIRKMLLDMKLIDPSVTRSMIFKKLLQLGLGTRAKREAFARKHAPE